MGPTTVNRTAQQSSQSCARLRPSAHRRISVTVRAASQKVGTLPAGGGTRTLKTGSQSTRDAGSQSTRDTAGGLNFFSALGTQFKRAGSAPKGRVDPNTIFLAGATGRLGARVLRELLSSGFKVRAGVRDVAAARKTVDVAVQYGLLDASALSALQLVEFDLEEPDSMSAALGNAGRVVCAVGISETSRDPSGPKRIDGDGTTALINAAAAAGVQQFVLVSSLGTGKIGFPASVLNMFFGILTFKRESEKALEASGMTYTIVRPGGLERPTDSYKETHNVTLSRRDTKFGGQVSRLQVAELIGAALRSPNLAENKVLEVTAETSAPRLSYEEVLDSIPSDFSKEEQQARQQDVEAARAALSAAQQRADAARQALERVDERVEELSERAKQAKNMEAGVKGQTSAVFKGSQAVQRQLQEAKAAVDKAVAQEAAAKAVLEASRKAASQGQLLSDKEKKEAREQALNPPKAKAAAPAPAPGFNLFGAKPAVAATKEEEEEEEEEKPADAVADGFNFFGTRILKAGTQVKAAVEPKVESAAAKVEGAAAKAGTQVKAVAQAATPAPAKAPASGGGNIFSNFLGLKPAVDADASSPVPGAKKAAPPPPPPPPPPAAKAPEAPKPPPPAPAPAAKKAAPPPPPAPAAAKKEPEELTWLEKRQQEAAKAAAAKAEEERLENERLQAAVAAWQQEQEEREAKEKAAIKAKEDARLKAIADQKAAAEKAQADAIAAAEKAKAERAAAIEKVKAEKAAAEEKAKAAAEEKAKAEAEKAKAAAPKEKAPAAPSAESNGASAPAVPTQDDQKKQVQAWIAAYKARSGKEPVKANNGQ